MWSVVLLERISNEIKLLDPHYNLCYCRHIITRLRGLSTRRYEHNPILKTTTWKFLKNVCYNKIQHFAQQSRHANNWGGGCPVIYPVRMVLKPVPCSCRNALCAAAVTYHGDLVTDRGGATVGQPFLLDTKPWNDWLIMRYKIKMEKKNRES